MQVGFRRIKWFNTRSAWQDMQHHRERRSAAIKQHLDMVDGINVALANAQQNQISGMASNAAHAALNRVQAVAKAKSAEIVNQIDNAQNVLDTAKAAGSSSATATVLDTVA